MTTFVVADGFVWRVAARRWVPVAAAGLYVAVFAWPLATTTARPAVTPVVAPAPSFVDELFGGSSCSSVVPAFRDGRGVGLKLFAVRDGTRAFASGLRSGDVLVAIDGIRVTSPDGALAAYERVRFARAFGVDLLRGGAPLRIVVDLDG